MFRMKKECFNQLCQRIIAAVGERNFKSKHYIDTVLKSTSIYVAHQSTSGGYISGEVKLALTLRMLAGGSYLDLSLIFHCRDTYVTTIFHEVVNNWICHNDVIPLPNESYFDDITAMRETALGFSEGSNAGILSGCIGALDGWLVKIANPSTKKDGIQNIAGYFIRKGFYAISCQVIVDAKKRILWRSIKCRGAEHDSTAFKKTRLYQKLVSNYSFFMRHGLYIIGDSAYPLLVFLLKPFDNAAPYSEEDAFNFYLSSARIKVECCFGEIDGTRWGIFWRPLSYSLKDNLSVIDAAMRLHNFIVDFRNSYEEPRHILASEMQLFEEETLAFMRNSNDIDSDFLIGVNNQSSPIPNDIGQLTQIDAELRDGGVNLRKRICNRFKAEGMRRPDRLGTAKSYARGCFGRVQEILNQ
jgi:hypothetical protein